MNILDRLFRLRRATRRPFAWLAVGAVAFGPAAAAALTVDEALDRHIAARGGRAWDEVAGVELKGTYTSFSRSRPATILHTREGYRADVAWNGDPVTIGWDGREAWWINQMQGLGLSGAPWPIAMRQQDRVALEVELDFPNSLFVARSRGYRLKLEEGVEFDGRPLAAVHLERPDGERETWFLDPETWLEVAREAPASEFGKAYRQTTYFDDFRRVGAVVLPFRRESQWRTRDETLEVEHAELNPAFDPAVFARPAPPGMVRLAALEGKWRVRVAWRSSARSAFKDSEYVATFAKRVHGAAVEETFTSAEGWQSLVTIGFDPGSERYLRTFFFELEPVPEVQEGVLMPTGEIVFDSPAYLFERYGQLRHRCSYSQMEPGRLSVIEEFSVDGGASYFIFARREYQRLEPE